MDEFEVIERIEKAGTGETYILAIEFVKNPGPHPGSAIWLPSLILIFSIISGTLYIDLDLSYISA